VAAGRRGKPAGQYDIVAHNLVTLRDRLAGFRTLERDGFIVRMDRREATIYGERVLALLSRARQSLATKYDITLREPIHVEIFPDQRDFAIRRSRAGARDPLL